MNNQSVNRFPKAASISLAFLFIAIAVLAGHGETHATLAADPDPLAQPNETVELVWVRQDPPIINVNNDPTYWEAPPGDRFFGSFYQYFVYETEIAWKTSYIDHGNDGYYLIFVTTFDRPPIVLNPPLRYRVRANASTDIITNNWGSEGIGVQFWYSSISGVIEPEEVLGYYPFHPLWDGTSSKDWMINPPAIDQEGATFQITAGWWNCPPCNVTWTYKSEPANAVERLGIDVLQPVVTYGGNEIPPGNTYFPETCPIEAVDSCSYTQQMSDRAEARINCFILLEGTERFLTHLKWIDLWKDTEGANLSTIWTIATIKLADYCEYGKRASGEYRLDLEDEYRLDLVLEQGSLQLGNVVDGQTTNVHTPLGAAVTASRGIFATGYNPDADAAIFRAYSTPLLLEPKSGSILVVQPNEEVELTSSGFGPVTELPHLYLPIVLR